MSIRRSIQLCLEFVLVGSHRFPAPNSFKLACDIVIKMLLRLRAVRLVGKSALIKIIAISTECITVDGRSKITSISN